MEVENPFNLPNYDNYDNYIKLNKHYKSKDEKLQQLKYVAYLLYDTDYENLYFINGNKSDLRRDNVIVNEPSKKRSYYA